MNKQEKIFKTLSDYKKQLEKLGYNVLYIGLCGSQNYNLDDEESDIDAKAIVLPNFDDFINKRIISTTIKMEGNGQVTIQDIQTYYNTIKKGNPAWLEAVWTPYSIGGKDTKEFLKRFKINLRAILGMAEQKRAALCHEYPSKVNEIAKWGFDPKQLHHILRLYDLMLYILKNPNAQPFIMYDDKAKQHLIDIKRNKNNWNVETAKKMADEYCLKIKDLIPKEYSFVHTTIKENDEYIFNMVKQHIKNELKTEEYDSARHYRTFGGPIPQSDLRDFPELKKHSGEDISYTIYMHLDIE